MANIKNLTEQNVEELQELFDKMKLVNPALEWQFYTQNEKTKVIENLTKDDSDVLSTLIMLEEKMDALNRKLDLIFGKYVLIKGRFVNV